MEPLPRWNTSPLTFFPSERSLFFRGSRRYSSFASFVPEVHVAVLVRSDKEKSFRAGQAVIGESEAEERG